MDTTTFFDNFERLAEAPNGVGKLRELILQMAVQGRLVPQDPNDEPAAVFPVLEARGNFCHHDITLGEMGESLPDLFPRSN